MISTLFTVGICLFVLFVVITCLCRCLRAAEGRQYSQTTTTVVAATVTEYQYPRRGDTMTTAYPATAQPVIYSISNSNWQHPSSQTSYPVQGYRSAGQIGFVYPNHQVSYNSRLDEPPPSYHEVAPNSSKENIPLGPLSSGQPLPRNPNPS